MQSSVISVCGGFSFAGIGATTKASVEEIKGSYTGKCEDSTLASTHLHVTISGGPLEAMDLPSWKGGLVANNSTWVLTDRGGKLIPIWDIIRRNHQAELGGVIDALRDSWEKMTGLEAEQQLTARLSYNKEDVLDEVREWNEKDLSPQQIEDNLNYLRKIKQDILDHTGSKSIWINEYITNTHFQEFVLSIVSLPIPTHGHIMFIMQSLIEPDELKHFDTRSFPEIDQVRGCLYPPDQSTIPSRVAIDVLDFESFDRFLKETMDNERIAKLKSGQLFPEANDELAKRVTKAIYSLRSYYKHTYDDILITILIYPFQSGMLGTVTLSSISLDTLENMRKQFLKQRTEFNQFCEKGILLHLQAFLFNLALEICTGQRLKQIIEQMTQTMKTLTPPLDNNLKKCLDQHQHSRLSLLQVNLKHLMTNSIQSLRSSVKKKATSSLQNILKTKVRQFQSPHDGDLSAIALKNAVVTDHLKKLGLFAFYPKRLLLKDALCIRQDILQFSLSNTSPSDLKQLAFLVLHKIMAYDIKCRSDLMLSNSETGPDHKDGDYYDDYGDYNDENDETESNTSDGVHPVDVILSLLICSDDTLLQDLLSRLAKLQFSVPFILPDPFTKQLTIPLWGLRSIIKDWKSTAGGKIEHKSFSIINYPMPIISFIAFSKQKQGKSKSMILNEIIGDSQSPFFHRDCPGGHYDSLLGQGMVDMCWYLSSGEPSDLFPDAVTFLNLHGDARQYPQQCKFLGQISSMCVVWLTEEVAASDSETIKTLKMFDSCPGGITLLDNVGKKPEVIMKAISGVHVIKLRDKNAAAIKRTILGHFKKKISSIKKVQSIEDCSIWSKEILTDEDSDTYRESFLLANEVKDLVTSNDGSKDLILPLQGRSLWQAWAENDRELHRQSHRGDKTLNQYTAEITSAKDEVRQQQYKAIEALTPVMNTFLTSLLTLGGPSNFITRSYFLQCLKLQLNNISRERISQLQQQYQDTKKHLAKLQDKTLSKYSDVKSQVEACQKKLQKLQDSIIDTSVGLEHFFRELGQVYEAAVESHKYNPEELSGLPKAAAELLIDGYPLEVVDGDAAHVPLKWFTAVFKEAVKILNNPKIFVMSVLGLQSTGKSTMLNTAFGLQFNVSAGRCTRGAFIQLLPLDEELKRLTQCKYILVVDTEGLRAPELNPLTTQKHDNELATFVIGLANVTLINIYGEVPGDMDDILQTSVHAFLRMTQVKSHRSCHFVHQNAGNNIKSEVGRSKFTEKLNRFTVDATREENCEGQYVTFNDVIKFNSETDVHHFQCLWKGDPPMAPVNEGYSQCAQKLKQSCIDGMWEQIRSQTSDLDMSSFHNRVGKLWESLLKENFVFSFKNTLEITAYNSLESEYSKWEWEFREGMLKWEQKLENEVKATTDPKCISNLIQIKCDNMIDKVIPGFYEPLKLKMDAFFKGKQAEVLIQWKKKFDIRLKNLKIELQKHARKHCTQQRQSKEAIAKIESDLEQYSKMITEKVKEYITKIRKKQSKLSQNLEKKNLESYQVKEILEGELFTSDKVELYTTKNIISITEAKYIYAVLNDCGGQLTEEDISTIIFGDILTISQVKNILKKGQQTNKQLKSTFDNIWIDLVNQIPFVQIENIDVEHEVRNVLLNFQNDESKVRDLLKQKPLSERNTLYFELKKEKHYICKSKGFWAGLTHYFYRGKSVEVPQYHVYAIEVTEKIVDAIKIYLKELETGRKDSDFSSVFPRKLLNVINKAYTVEAEAIKERLTFTHEYKLELFTYACGYAIPKFKKMSESFRERHDPRLYLDKKVKPPLYSLFKNQYYQAEAEEAIASTLCAHFVEPIKAQVNERIGTKMVSLMKSNDALFSSKMSLKVKILCDLQEEDDFTTYMEYILDVKESILKWIKHYTVKFCDENVSGGTRLQLASKEEAKRLIGVVENKLDDLDQSSVQNWVEVFCNDLNIKEEIGINLHSKDILDSFERMKLNLENFKQRMRLELTALKEEIQCCYKDIQSEEEMKAWRDKPHDLLQSLIGCTEQCPFCGEQCDLQDSKHSHNGPRHSVRIHRSICLTGYRNEDTKIMSTGFCPAYVSGNEKENAFKNGRTDGKFHPYKEYNKIYPEWFIDNDPTSANSLFWKKFVGRYMHQIAELCEAKPREVPKSWSTTSKQEVRENLRSLYSY